MMVYFDCLCEIGPRNNKDSAAPWSAGDVLGWMDRCGIAGGLVVHTLSITNDPVDARERLEREIRIAPGRLFPVWAVVPPHAGDFERDPAELVEKMRAHGVRAVKLFPKTHAFPLSLPVMGSTFRELERARILTLIDFSELPADLTAAYDALDRILGAFPDLPVVLQRHDWATQRFTVPLMEAHRNLHIELSNYQISRGIEVYASRFGAERLLFGTGLPEMSPGAARAFVDYARIPEGEKEKIAGGNLMGLLGGLRPDPSPPHPLDEVLSAASKGEPLRGFPVLDAHCHILHEGGNGAGRVVMYRGDAEGLVEGMDVMGVGKTAVMSWAGPLGSDPVESNEIVRRAVERFPDRFLGVVYLNPAHLGPDELLEQLVRRVEEQGFVGAKPYPYAGLRYTDPAYARCWQYINHRGMYVLIHSNSFPDIGELARRYPRAQWVVAHSGGTFGNARAVVDLMAKHPNVWAELTLTTVTNGVIEWMVSRVGDRRILFGTDAPMRDPRPQLGWVAWADIPVESRRRILGANFLDVLGLRRRL